VLSGLVDCTRLYTDDALAVPAAGDGAPGPSAYVSYADGRRETVCGDDLQVTAFLAGYWVPVAGYWVPVAVASRAPRLNHPSPRATTDRGLPRLLHLRAGVGARLDHDKS
jgi:hypothetical protein